MVNLVNELSLHCYSMGVLGSNPQLSVAYSSQYKTTGQLSINIIILKKYFFNHKANSAISI